VIVRNSKQGGAWGNEEREGGKFPFAKEKQFDIVIVSEGDALQVYVDGEHHSAFKKIVFHPTLSTVWKLSAICNYKRSHSIKGGRKLKNFGSYGWKDTI